MVAALELLKAGCRLRIGMGHSVNIWTNPWIPRTPSFQVITPKSHDAGVLYVRDLILVDTREWDVELINALFWPEDRDLILQIPAYHLALSLACSAGTSSARWCRNTWQVVWQAHVPNNVKMFLWRAIRNILPTASNLRKKLPYEIVSCPFCDFEAESPIHTLLHCSFARQVWALFEMCWNDIDSLAWSVEEWIQVLSLKLFAADFSLVAMLYWTIWWSRNLKLANRSFLLPLQANEFVRNYLLAFHSQGLLHTISKSASHSFWHPPPPLDCIKINFDGRIRDGGRSLGLGALAHNSEGVCLAWLTFKFDRGELLRWLKALQLGRPLVLYYGTSGGV
ncbi:hypothetical protein Sango_2790200 [Sesamum angolense]|uniref:Reverse transcriptase zinc-binding domain-containing protein n=1 Tax=Sesamum angolense TaxID=2727404 RepID=A0AAE1T852_9LAMI|nr:hypothetical protein Sango_2790200 [Sesamum angolense]